MYAIEPYISLLSNTKRVHVVLSQAAVRAQIFGPRIKNSTDPRKWNRKTM